MTETILTLHPDPSKQGVRIEKTKYEMMRAVILEVLKSDKGMIFTELSANVENRLQGSFDGSVMWYFTAVKLDLEARGQLKRIPKSKPQLVQLGAREAL